MFQGRPKGPSLSVAPFHTPVGEYRTPKRR